MKREIDHLATFMHMAVEYARQIGFTGQFYCEPKPARADEASIRLRLGHLHQVLRTYGLERHVKMNIETNHATLAGHEMQHELEYAGMQGFLGSIDANTGDPLVGWTPTNSPRTSTSRHRSCTRILKYGGLARWREFRRQGAARELRAGRSLPCSYRRHGCIRPGPEESPQRCVQTAPFRGSWRSDMHRGRPRWAGGSRPGAKASPRWRPRCSPRAKRRPTGAAGRNCSRTSSTATSDEPAIHGDPPGGTTGRRGPFAGLPRTAANRRWIGHLAPRGVGDVEGIDDLIEIRCRSLRPH